MIAIIDTGLSLSPRVYIIRLVIIVKSMGKKKIKKKKKSKGFHFKKEKVLYK